MDAPMAVTTIGTGSVMKSTIVIARIISASAI